MVKCTSGVIVISEHCVADEENSAVDVSVGCALLELCSHCMCDGCDASSCKCATVIGD